MGLKCAQKSLLKTAGFLAVFLGMFLSAWGFDALAPLISLLIVTSPPRTLRSLEMISEIGQYVVEALCATLTIILIGKEWTCETMLFA